MGCLNSFLKGREGDVGGEGWWPKKKKNDVTEVIHENIEEVLGEFPAMFKDKIALPQQGRKCIELIRYLRKVQ